MAGMKLDKNYLLKESKTFCMLPWVHLYTTPGGTAYPCCISNPAQVVGNSNHATIYELMNSEPMRNLRKDMIEGVPNTKCSSCYKHEAGNVASFRQGSNKNFAEFFEDTMDNTTPDFSIKEFKMRYFDIRFSNICNFKCRTCNSEFSSQWEQEDKKLGINGGRTIPVNDSDKLLNEIKTYIPHMKRAYFAGGEPLITEGHYILLEEMIRTGRTDIELLYNTNISNLKYKDKDLLSLWKHFEKDVIIAASVDHVGKRAEYIRHGTKWAEVEENLLKINEMPNVALQINTVVSLYNFLTLDIFYQYLMDKGIYTKDSTVFSLYNMNTPRPISALALPDHMKQIGIERLKNLSVEFVRNKMTSDKVSQLSNAIRWVGSETIWDNVKTEFWEETKRLDNARNENFVEVFPELAELLNETN